MWVSGDCDAVGAKGTVGVVTLIIAALVVSLKILRSCSNAWRRLDGSVAFPLLSLIISMNSFSAV